MPNNIHKHYLSTRRIHLRRDGTLKDTSDSGHGSGSHSSVDMTVDAEKAAVSMLCML